jgi:hypothetical protein
MLFPGLHAVLRNDVFCFVSAYVCFVGCVHPYCDKVNVFFQAVCGHVHVRCVRLSCLALPFHRSTDCIEQNISPGEMQRHFAECMLFCDVRMLFPEYVSVS